MLSHFSHVIVGLPATHPAQARIVKPSLWERTKRYLKHLFTQLNRR